MTLDGYISLTITFLKDKILLSQEKFKSLIKLALNKMNADHFIHQVIECVADTAISQDELESLAEMGLKKMRWPSSITFAISVLKDKVSQGKVKSFIDLALNKWTGDEYEDIYKVIKWVADVIPEDKLESLSCEGVLSKMTNVDSITGMLELLKDKTAKDKFKYLTEIALNRIATLNSMTEHET